MLTVLRAVGEMCQIDWKKLYYIHVLKDVCKVSVCGCVCVCMCVRERACVPTPPKEGRQAPAGGVEPGSSQDEQSPAARHDPHGG